MFSFINVFRTPTAKQLEDYDNELVMAVKNSNLAKIKELRNRGKSMSACNSHSESIVHIACRRSEFEIVEFMLENGADNNIIDDCGRNVLHDCCWRSEPQFDVLTLLLDSNLHLLHMADIRGSNPLNYVRREHWFHYCAYFWHQQERYWAVGKELREGAVNETGSTSNVTEGALCSDNSNSDEDFSDSSV